MGAWDGMDGNEKLNRQDNLDYQARRRKQKTRENFAERLWLSLTFILTFSFILFVIYTASNT